MTLRKVTIAAAALAAMSDAVSALPEPPRAKKPKTPDPKKRAKVKAARKQRRQ